MMMAIIQQIVQQMEMLRAEYEAIARELQPRSSPAISNCNVDINTNAAAYTPAIPIQLIDLIKRKPLPNPELFNRKHADYLI